MNWTQDIKNAITSIDELLETLEIREKDLADTIENLQEFPLRVPRSFVAMMRKALPDQPITCFTVSFPDGVDTEGNPSDLPYARKVAKHLGVDLEEVLIQPGAINRLEEMVTLLDEPQELNDQTNR